MPTATEPELGFLLEAYQLRDPELSTQFEATAKPILRRMAKKRRGGLPIHAIEDVMQETFLSLANPALALFDAARSTASQYLLGRLLNAVKSTQLVHGLRRAGSDFDKEPQREFVPFDDLNLRSSMDVPVGAIQSRQALQKIFAGVDVDLREACMRVFAEDESQAAVAADLHMSRFALARKLSGIRTAALERVAIV